MSTEIRCDVCGTKIRNLYWHTTSERVLDRAECRAESSEPGVWLCSICEDGAHKWMQQNPSTLNNARAAVEEMTKRLQRAIFVPRRTRRRRNEEEDLTQPNGINHE